MADSTESRSIFSQRLDRAAFAAFFLGAIVPLCALVYVVDQFVLPTVPDGLASNGLIAMVFSMAVLTAGSYLVLRRTTRKSIGQMDRDNARLASLLATSRTLTSAEQANEIAATATTCALDLSRSRGAYLLVRGKDDDLPPELFGAAGEDAESHFAETGERLLGIAQGVIESGHAAHAGPDRNAGRAAVIAVPIDGEEGAIGVLAVVQRDTRDFDEAQIDAVTTLAALTSVAMRNADLRDAQRNFFSHITEILVAAVDSHIGYQSGHGSRVAQIANRLGRTLNLDPRQLQNLHFAARLHDIGMLKIDRSLKHTSSACEKHTVLGSRMLSRIRVWEALAPIVQSHHEWYDGNGYPDGLAGDAIPLEARIIAVADAFDSMTSDTSYQIALSIDAAVAEIRDGAGTQFDPTLVDAFLQLVEADQIS